VNSRVRVGFVFTSVLVLAGLVGAACGGGGMKAPSGAAERFSGAKGGEDLAGLAPDAALVPMASPAPHQAPLGEFQIPGITQRIIKTANVSVQVRKGTFEQRFQQATIVASRHGGFVSSSRTAEAAHRSGVLVIRIPASQFEVAMGELKALGRVKGEQISGEDVTAQFVDLQARLRNWEAQEEVLLRLMRQSKTIDESLKVQRTLQDVQLAIEEIRGQLRVLTDQTDLSTITMSMAEAGAVAAKPKQGLTFAKAWHQAIHAIAAVFAAVIIGLGYLIPIALIALALLVMLLGYRRLRPKVASGGASSTMP
jgi:uncharacterized protein DUF4349